jgi:hypothetical protein
VLSTAALLWLHHTPLRIFLSAQMTDWLIMRTCVEPVQVVLHALHALTLLGLNLAGTHEHTTNQQASSRTLPANTVLQRVPH